MFTRSVAAALLGLSLVAAAPAMAEGHGGGGHGGGGWHGGGHDGGWGHHGGGWGGSVFIGGDFGWPGYGYDPYYAYPPPVYYAPPPVYYAPPPVYAPPAAPAVGTAPAAIDQSYCRDYDSTVMVNGTAQPAHGVACRQPDGTWRIVQ